MSMTTTGLNDAVAGFTGAATHVSLHTATPNSSGSNEVTGGSPAYARKALSWAGASGGSQAASQVTFDVPGSTTITHAGFWTASSAGTFLGSAALSANETFGAQGTYALTPTATIS